MLEKPILDMCDTLQSFQLVLKLQFDATDGRGTRLNVLQIASAGPDRITGWATALLMFQFDRFVGFKAEAKEQWWI